MNTIEIRNKINENNKMIEQILSPSTFILNNSVAALLEENRQLQEICPHLFEDGYCIYCDKEEGE